MVSREKYTRRCYEERQDSTREGQGYTEGEKELDHLGMSLERWED
jgi:hypothetical protein